MAISAVKHPVFFLREEDRSAKSSAGPPLLQRSFRTINSYAFHSDRWSSGGPAEDFVFRSFSRKKETRFTAR